MARKKREYCWKGLGVPLRRSCVVSSVAAIALGCSPSATLPNPPERTPVHAASAELRVLNQCFVVGDRFLLHARVDARGPNGGIYRQVWSFNCKGDDCNGAELSLNPFHDGKPLGALDLNAFKQAKVRARSPSHYLIDWGVYAFRIDLTAGRVDVDGSGMQGHDIGSAPCSQNGVLWPPTAVSTGNVPGM
jgi:hypothetical protein